MVELQGHALGIAVGDGLGKTLERGFINPARLGETEKKVAPVLELKQLRADYPAVFIHYLFLCRLIIILRDGVDLCYMLPRL